MTNPLYHYVNGNYTVTIFSDGTKVRETLGDSFLPEFSENIDIKITNYCDAACAWCHEKSTVSGEPGNLVMPYLDTLMPGTELAIGGGNPLSHPQLIPFLEKLKEMDVIANITVNQFHFKQPHFRRYLDGLVKFGLVYGVGLSMKIPDDAFIEGVKQYDNAVIHTINGINPAHHFELLYGQGLKVLLLGYKDFGRGSNYLNPTVEARKMELYDRLPGMIDGFKVVSFDNLAIEQLNPKRFMLQSQWDEFYMGDDGGFTFYIDVIQNEFGKNSTTKVRHPILDGMSIKNMFKRVQGEYHVRM